MTSRKITRAALAPLVILLLLVGLFAFFYFQGSNPSIDETSVPISADGWFEILFSEPTDPQASTLRGGPDATLAAAIDRAQYTVDVAIYHLNLWSLRDALIQAHRRGVKVRLITDGDHVDESEVVDLIDAGVTVAADDREPLMHHKFVVIDGLDVWTGSMNFTVNGAYRNDNNLVHVRSNRVAQDYLREFEEMFIERRFGALSRANTPYPQVSVEGVTFEIYFSPDDDVALELNRIIQSAEESIDFMVYSLTSDLITEAILTRAKESVSVRGVIERDQVANAGSDFQRLRDNGVDIRMDGNPRKMHHKVFIIDEKVVITGSYNFSRSAEEFNDENVMILYDIGAAKNFLLEFNRIFEMATP
jgi:phosphatidylserine/phosphatidylglycerophosphate/cardiolipin synthase-like enzyme